MVLSVDRSSVIDTWIMFQTGYSTNKFAFEQKPIAMLFVNESNSATQFELKQNSPNFSDSSSTAWTFCSSVSNVWCYVHSRIYLSMQPFITHYQLIFDIEFNTETRAWRTGRPREDTIENKRNYSYWRLVSTRTRCWGVLKIFTDFRGKVLL